MTAVGRLADDRHSRTLGRSPAPGIQLLAHPRRGEYVGAAVVEHREERCGVAVEHAFDAGDLGR